MILVLSMLAGCSPQKSGESLTPAEESVVTADFLPEEIDELIAEGKTVLLPKVLDADRMELRRYTGPHDLTEGAYGIMEPVGEPFTDYALIDIALIPGMAFDAAGHRLGRGRGYYDRFLSLLIPPSSLLLPRFFGLCFDFQKVDTVPSDDHDIPVDIVI